MNSWRLLVAATVALLVLVIPSQAIPLENSENGNSTRPLCPARMADKKRIEVRVVGGRTAEPQSFPFAVQVRRKGQVICGGSLLTDRHVLTAAHCLSRGVEKMEVKVGDHVNAVQSARLHPQFNHRTYNNDIGVIVLGAAFSWPTVCLPYPDSDPVPGTLATVVGWGRVYYGGPRAQSLQEVTLPIVSRAQCQKHLVTRINTNMVCAGGQRGRDACLGDSGGPLLDATSPDSSIQIGVVSFGKKCALAGVSGVYTRVSRYVNWLQTVTSSAGCAPCVA